MITKEKLAQNLKNLRLGLPQKPSHYVSDYPVDIESAFSKYCNQSTVHGLETCVRNFNENDWPIVLWYDPEDTKFGRTNMMFYKWIEITWKMKRKLKGFGVLWMPVLNQLLLKKDFDKSLVQAFSANRKYFFKRIKSNPILNSKTAIIDEISKTFTSGYWSACICITLPLLDFVARRIFKTSKLSTDIGKICKLFAQNGFASESVDHLMPHVTMVMSMSTENRMSKEDQDALYEKIKDNNFGVIGAVLSSFLRFANQYYSYYKEDLQEINVINRHAILHGSVTQFGTKINTIKLLTFLFLLLELNPVLNILLDEE